MAGQEALRAVPLLGKTSLFIKPQEMYVRLESGTSTIISKTISCIAAADGFAGWFYAWCV